MIDSMTHSPSQDGHIGSSHDAYAASRRAMVNSQLRTSDVNTPLIISTMDTVSREIYVPENKRDFAYIDRAIALTGQRMLNPPVTHGLMLERAAIKPDDNVMIVGAATGYLAALVAPHVASLVAVEEETALFDALQQNLAGQSNIMVEKGDLTSGFGKSAPYSLIIIDGAVETIPTAIARQLADNGRLICGIWDNGVSRLAQGSRSGKNDVILHSYADADVAQLAGFAKSSEYRFS